MNVLLNTPFLSLLNKSSDPNYINISKRTKKKGNKEYYY